MKKLFQILCSIFLSYIFSTYGQNYWQQTNGPDSGLVQSLLVTSNNKILAGTLNGGIFSSTDSGNNWVEANSGITDTSILCLTKNSFGHLFAGSLSNGIFRSLNNGSNWVQINSGLAFPITVSAITSSPNNSIFAATNQGIYRSTDNGISWSQLTGFLDTTSSSLLTNQSNHIFAATSDSGIFRSTDNGVSWTKTNNGLTSLVVKTLAIDKNGTIYAGTYNGGVFKSTNNGDDWLPINDGLTYPWIQCLTINSLGYLFCGTFGGGIYRSLNEGKNWSELNTGLIDLTVFSLAIDTSGFIYAGAENGLVYRSTELTKKQVHLLSPNGGEIWKINTINEIKWSITNVENIKIEYSMDGDTTWNMIISSLTASIGSYYWLVPDTSSNFCSIRIRDTKDSLIMDESDNFFTFLGKPKTETEPNNIASQANLMEIGDSLDASINPAGDIDYYKFSANQNDTIIIFIEAKNNSQLYSTLQIFSSNGSYLQGTNYYYWETLQLPFIIPYTGDLYIRFAYNWGNYPNLYIQDSLSHFSSIQNQNLNKLNKVSDETGDYKISLLKFKRSAPIIQNIYSLDTYYNSSRFQITFYPNGLNTSIKLEYGKTSSYGSTVTSPYEANGIYLTGLFAKIPNLDANTVYHYRSIAENDSGTYYTNDFTFSTPEQPVNWLNKSIDSLDYPINPLSDVSFSDLKNGFAVGPYHYCKTTDGGNSWKEAQANYYLSSVFCIDSMKIVAGSYDNATIIRTTNSGQTWQTVYSYSNRSIYDLIFTDSNNGIAVGSNGMILKTTNGGSNWAIKSSGTSNYLNAVNFSDLNHGWIVGDAGTILKSTDGGSTWSPIYGSTSYNFNGVYFVDSLRGFLISAGNGQILRTTDGGINWGGWNSGMYLLGISVIGKDNGVIVGGSGQILLTTNAGVNWISQKSGTSNWLYSVSKVGNNWVTVGDYGTILKSTYNLVSVKREENPPTDFSLSQNYPNPFNPTTTIRYSLQKAGKVLLKVYDLIGNEVATLINEEKEIGNYEVEFSAKGGSASGGNVSELSSGIYLIKLQAGDYSSVKKMMLLK